jgi:hypothetical protein
MTMRRILAALLFVLLPTQVFAANAYITEFSVLGTANNGAPQVATLPPVAHQKVDFSGGATNAAAFNAQTKYIRIHCDAACSIRVGATATTTYMRIPLDGIEYFGVQGGDVLSIIANP